jgi:hypothetical protein
MWCRDGRPSTQMPTSKHWRFSRSVSSKSDHTKIQQNSCFSMTLHILTKVWGLGKPSQNLTGLCCTILPTALILLLLISIFSECWKMQSVLYEILGRDNDVIREVRTWLCKQDMDWYWQGIHALASCWHKAIAVDRDRAETQSI